jgi:hypothetical protein
MAKLLLKSILFLILLFGSYAVFYAYNPVNEELNKANDYLLAIEPKHQLLEKLPSPRIIFMGGSSVAFGIDSKSIGDSLGLNGFNLGLHAGLGLQFMVNEALEMTKPGDILVVSTEYFLGEGQMKMLAYMRHNFPASEQYMNLNASEKISYPYELAMDNILSKNSRVQNTFLKGKKTVVKQDTNNVYKKNGFNERGDYELHLDQEARPWGIFVKYDQKDEPYSSGIQMLNKLASLKEKGVQIFYVFPGYPLEEYNRFQKPLQSFENQLKAGLQFPVLGKVTDFLYPETDFYDTVYHLRRKGRSERTKTLVQLLRKALKLNKGIIQ